MYSLLLPGARHTLSALPEIRPGQSLALLQELHILTRDGRLNQDSRRKLKQVYHLYQFIEPLLNELLAEGRLLTVADQGAGKSYLGFILYDLFFKSRNVGHIYGIDVREELVERARRLAEKLGFARMSFHRMHAADAARCPDLPAEIDVVTALHACDTATDDAIRFALEKRAAWVVLVPCCQAEVAARLRSKKSDALSTTPLSELWRHPIHTREFASLVTNTLRCLQLEAHGYQVTVTELVGWEHSLKNELIIARQRGTARGNAAQRLEAILRTLNLEDLRARFADVPPHSDA